jgi:hypothetical protein
MVDRFEVEIYQVVFNDQSERRVGREGAAGFLVGHNE